MRRVNKSFVPTAFLLCLATFLVIETSDVGAKGGNSGKHTDRVFRELVVKGERPEIVSCLLTTIENVKTYQRFSEIIIPDDVSDTAVLQETITMNKLVRTIGFSALAKDRKHGVIRLNSWSEVNVTCNQQNEATVTTTIVLAHGFGR